MENVYMLVIYLAVVIGLVGLALLKVSDIFEQKRDRKYYEMIREDADFWQMKAEQSGLTIGNSIMDAKEDRWYGGSSQIKAKQDFNEMLEHCKEMDESLDRLDKLLEELKNPKPILFEETDMENEEEDLLPF